MPQDTFSALRAQLGDDASQALQGLPPDELRDLAEAIGEARHRQAVALREAGDRALGHIPRVLRGPIKRIVG